MKIVLHSAKFSSPFGLLCSLMTGSGYSHASVIDNHDKRWDTTLSRGSFDVTDSLRNEPDREITIVDIPDKNPSEFLKNSIGRKYDVKGLMLWPFRSEDPDRWYCFEAVYCCLKSVGIDLHLGKRKSGKNILDGLLSLGYKATTTKGKHYGRNNA